MINPFSHENAVLVLPLLPSNPFPPYVFDPFKVTFVECTDFPLQTLKEFDAQFPFDDNGVLKPQ
jgi:hypothetical protein